jgi:hypothetical protein
VNIDKIYKILINGAKERKLEKQRKEKELDEFIIQRFEEVALKALKENKNEED